MIDYCCIFRMISIDIKVGWCNIFGYNKILIFDINYIINVRKIEVKTLKILKIDKTHKQF
jgi:hypothetical protein